ncbi:MAG: DegT/DnrJ/EryC1/StrS family aminotransferase [Desulfobacteraceae bacterium]|nr:DegT/DnrJ/EryC1/StrS family aminotransferase [Desulfobacteraceae bacterium]
MQIPFFELNRQYLDIQEEIDQAVAEVFKSGWYILGEELKAFETEFSAHCRGGYAIGVGSGTDALQLALLACGVKPGDEVITVPNTAVPTVVAIVAAGARPVLVDIDPKTYTMDPERLESYLKAQQLPLKAKAVIPVHLYGHPADMNPIIEIARKFGLRVIEDACQAVGAEYCGARVGILGDAGCFSFYPTKNLGGYGDGGMVVVNEASLANHLRMLRNYGEESKYNNAVFGYNSRLDELQAAVLRVKLRYLDVWNQRRRSIAGLYRDLLADADLSLPCEAPYARHIYHLYVVRSRERDHLQRKLKEHGIITSIHYPMPVHYQKAYQILGYSRGDFPVAERFSSEILSLPLYPELTDEQIAYICHCISV